MGLASPIIPRHNNVTFSQLMKEYVEAAQRMAGVFHNEKMDYIRISDHHMLQVRKSESRVEDITKAFNSFTNPFYVDEKNLSSRTVVDDVISSSILGAEDLGKTKIKKSSLQREFKQSLCHSLMLSSTTKGKQWSLEHLSRNYNLQPTKSFSTRPQVFSYCNYFCKHNYFVCK